MVKDKLARQLHNLGLVEAYSNKLKSSGPTSYFRGRHQIDGVWCTRILVPESVSAYNFNLGAGDHRAYDIDFQVKSILGDLALPMYSPKKTHLVCSFPIIVQRCL